MAEMNCQMFDDLLDDLARGTLDEAQARAAAAHMEQCEKCAAAFADAQQVGSLLRSPGALAEPLGSGDIDRVREQALAAIRSESARVQPRVVDVSAVKRSATRRPLRFVELAAAFAGGVVLTYLMLTPLDTTQPAHVATRQISYAREVKDSNEVFGETKSSGDVARATRERFLQPATTVAGQATAEAGDLAAEAEAAMPAELAKKNLGQDAGMNPELDSAVAAARDVDIAESRAPIERKLATSASEPAPPAQAMSAPAPLQAAAAKPYEAVGVAPAATAPAGRLAGLADRSRLVAPASAMAPAEGEAGRAGSEMVAARSSTNVEADTTITATGGAARRSSAVATTESLFLAALEAEFRSQPAGAIAIYERLLAEHPTEPVAAQAALRIGLLAEGPLGDPVQARLAFEKCLTAPLSEHLSEATLRDVRGRLERLPQGPE